VAEWIDEEPGLIEARQAVEDATAGPPAAAPPETIFERQSGWRVVNLGELWRYRELLFFLVWRDVKVRYKQTLLGASWAVLQPLTMTIAFTIFFARMAGASSGDLPYPLFALMGLLPWLFFATAMTSAGNAVVGSERLITKVYFPRLLIPFSAVGAAVVDFAIALVLTAAMMGYYRLMPGLSVILALPIFGLIVVLAMGIGTLLAALNVAYRDVKAMVPFLTQLGMFATPTIYLEPSGASRSVLWLNPMAALIASFRASIFGQPIPWGPLGLAACVAFASGLVGCLYFRKTEQSFADLI
jgi:lipopolysaccharide transport system permease protein